LLCIERFGSYYSTSSDDTAMSCNRSAYVQPADVCSTSYRQTKPSRHNKHVRSLIHALTAIVKCLGCFTWWTILG